MASIGKILDKCSLFGYFIVGICEFCQGSWFSGVGWTLAGVGWYAFESEKKFFDQAMDICKKYVHGYVDKIDELESEKKHREANEINLDTVDVDHVLKVGRDLQNSDTWRGAQFDTVKLLCDTIEALREKRKGTRNCDIYDTRDKAFEACFKDRGYCSDPIEERKSTISFMLSDEKNNAWHKSGEGKDDQG